MIQRNTVSLLSPALLLFLLPHPELLLLLVEPILDLLLPLVLVLGLLGLQHVKLVCLVRRIDDHRRLSGGGAQQGEGDYLLLGVMGWSSPTLSTVSETSRKRRAKC